ncbi:VOC family protein [Saccharibacillus alkalitolerans]|uniref:VOC family protein n=1 Tax=Saccharibacillus alkalitolerans TaxID=2705290 RepID=A0ABX0F802_9BACL|nr:VOC family protein [Saccharibacillus alkalitolerans]NGZ76525.1 VOC family protein [Saccharibacillus alkalitolerans]
MNLMLNWITLRIRDLEASLAFYHGILGLPIERRFESRGKRIAMLGPANQPKIELIEGSEITVRPNNGISVGFEVESLERAMEELQSKGIPVARGPIEPNPHLRFFYILDPDGFEVQLAQHR